MKTTQTIAKLSEEILNYRKQDTKYVLMYCSFSEGVFTVCLKYAAIWRKTFDKVTIHRKSPARLFPCQSVIHIVCAWQNMYQWINSVMLTFRVSVCLIFAVSPLWSDTKTSATRTSGSVSLQVLLYPILFLYLFAHF